MWVFELCGEGPSLDQQHWSGCTNSVSVKATVLVLFFFVVVFFRKHRYTLMLWRRKGYIYISVAEPINLNCDLVINEFKRQGFLCVNSECQLGFILLEFFFAELLGLCSSVCDMLSQCQHEKKQLDVLSQKHL